MSVAQHLCSKLFKFWGETPRKITGAGTGGGGLLWLLLPGWPWVIDTEPQTCGSGNVWKMICLLAIEVSFEKRKWEILKDGAMPNAFWCLLHSSPNKGGDPGDPFDQVLPTNHWDLDTYIYIYG